MIKDKNSRDIQAEGVVAELSSLFAFDREKRSKIREELLAAKTGAVIETNQYKIEVDKNGFHLITKE